LTAHILICYANLSIEEAEAIRLNDLERLSISRPTFHRVPASARTKLADALLNGKAMRIEGAGESTMEKDIAPNGGLFHEN